MQGILQGVLLACQGVEESNVNQMDKKVWQKTGSLNGDATSTLEGFLFSRTH